MPRLFALIFLITGLTFSSTAFAQTTPQKVRPHDFDREVLELAKGVYQIHLEPDESADLDVQGMIRIMIDETRIVDARIAEDHKRLFLRGKQPGKAVVSLVFKDGRVSTFVISVNGDMCAEERKDRGHPKG